ncbi:MAG: magnesium chelatase, partial [Deltaproteobacteria bacterium HGW-Deltaproteobacteria-7]
VETARLRQLERFSKNNSKENEETLINLKTCNADMGPADIRTICQLDGSGENLMRTAMRQLQLSARAYHRILKLARTIADLAGEEKIEPNHIAEALQYRPKLMTEG